jgi:hypothetical protein
MANEQTFGVKEVMSLVIRDYSSANALLYIPYATSTDVMSESDRLEITGGQGNYSLTAWDHSKKLKGKLSLPLVNMAVLAHLTGTDLAVAATTAHRDEELITSGATPTVTLSSTPTSGTLKIYTLTGNYDLTEVTSGTPSSTQNTFSASGTTITLNSTSHVAGTKVIAMYDFTTAATAQLVTILADRFTDFVRITGMGLWRNIATGDDEVVSFDLKKCKFKPNFTLTQATTAATTLELEYDCYYEASGLNKLYANIVKI